MDYRRAGKVSVWLGIFPDPPTFRTYLTETYSVDGDATCPFWNDLGVKWLDHDFQETHCDPQVIPIGQFLQREFSYLESFRQSLMAACDRLRITSVNTAIFVYDLAYPEERPFPCPFLRFIGTFPYKVEHPDSVVPIISDPVSRRKGL
jgi:hypothetical protein